MKCYATHNDPRAKRRSADQFRHLRSATHLYLGAPVMLTTNRIWEQYIVSLSLMNGARGVVVAILYCPEGTTRLDKLSLASTGYPAGKAHGPLPNVVIVDFPDYTGPSFFANLPRTWIPVPSVSQINDQTKK